MAGLEEDDWGTVVFRQEERDERYACRGMDCGERRSRCSLLLGEGGKEEGGSMRPLLAKVGSGLNMVKAGRHGRNEHRRKKGASMPSNVRVNEKKRPL